MRFEPGIKDSREDYGLSEQAELLLARLKSYIVILTDATKLLIIQEFEQDTVL